MRKTLLALLCTAGALTSQAATPTTATQDGVTYRLSGTTATVSAVDAALTSLTISSPVTIEGTEYNVQLSGAGTSTTTFKTDNLTSITLTGNITAASGTGSYIFYNCTNLKSVDMSGITGTLNVGSNWFQRCSSLTDVKLPPECASIGSSAFSGCTSLASIEIPAGVKSISGQFSGCTGLKTVTFATGSQLTTCNLSNLPVENIDLPAAVTSVNLSGTALTTADLSGCTALRTLGGFRGCTKLTSVKLPENSSLTAIPAYAFANCTSLTDVNIPATVTSVGKQAFQGCTAITGINIPASVTTIGATVFQDCTALATLGTDGSTWTSIGENAFNGCKVLTGPLNLTACTTIGKAAFLNNTALQTVNFGDRLTTIGDQAFQYSGLTSVTFPASITSIGTQTTSNASIQSGSSTFAGCKNLTTVNFAENGALTTIPSAAFVNSGITELILPDYITTMSANIIQGCTALKKIQFPANEAYTSIPAGFAHNAANDVDGALEEVIIPDNVTSIGTRAFKENKISRLTLPGSIQSIETEAFISNNLTELTIPESCITLGTSSFENNQIATINWNESLTSIGRSAFSSNKLTDIGIPAQITTINQSAFQSNPISSIRLNDGLVTIGQSAFSSATATYTELSIPASVKTIQQQAFDQNSNLKTLYLYADPEHDGTGKSFGNRAFGTGQLADVYTINAVPPTIVQGTFSSGTYNNANLHVLQGSEQAYTEAEYWKNFKNLNDSSLTGITDVTEGGSEGAVEIYTLSGVRVYTGAAQLAPALDGLYIVREGDRARKVVF